MKQLIVAFLLARANLAAQNITATLVGAVQDETGAFVPGAKITLLHKATQSTRTAESDSGGNYAFNLLRPGAYELVAEKQGFKRAVVSGIDLQVDQTARVDITLPVGSVAESLSVTAAAPLVASETSSVGQVVTEKQIQELPLNGRSFFSLVLLAPGTVPTMPRSFIASNHPIPGQLNVPAFYVGGAREKSNGYLVDGIDSQDMHYQTPSIYPSVDTISEFKLQTNAYSAEYGRFAAQVNVTTRSGSNDWHGSAWEFLRNDALDATNFFTNLSGLRKNPLRYNQFGATFGGPLSIPKLYSGRNRTFFFTSWESTRIRRGGTGQLSVPTAEQRAGDFSALGFRNNNRIYDPATTRTVNGVITRDPFPNNIIPADRITQFGRTLMNFYPLPTANVSTGNNYAVTLRDFSDSDQFMGRVDHRFGDKDSIFGRYTIMDGALTNSSSIPLNGTSTTATTNNAAINYVHIFTPSTLYELRAGYNRPKYFNLQNGSNGPNIWQSLGLQNLLNDPIAFGLPSVSVSNLSGLGAGTFVPSTQLTNTYQLFQSLTLIRGSHTLKTGADIRKINYNDRTERMQNGQFSFTGGLTTNPASPAGTGIALADLLLGLPLTASGSNRSLSSNYNGFVYGFFLQDDWKITRRITLNLGLRYDLSPRLVEKNNKLSLFDRSYPGGRILLAGTSQAFIPGIGLTEGVATPRGLVPTDTNDWGPRIGIAIRPFNDNRTAIRAGYGIFYDQIELQDLRTWARNPPFGAIISVQSDQNGNSDSPTVLKATELFPTNSRLAPPDIYSPGDKYVSPYYQQWNFGIQREIVSGVLLDVGYLGSKGTHLARRILANQAVLDADPNRPTPITSRRPYPLYGNTIRLTHNSTNSSYHGLLTKVEKRFSQGLSLLFSYTYAKALDTGSLIDANPRDNYNLNLDKGRADFDIRHRAVLSGNWELPFGKGRRFANSPLPSALFGGWQLNTIASFRTGFPFSVSAQGDVCNCAASNQLAQQTGDPHASFTQSRLHWFNTAAFTQPARGTFGTSGRNILDGPGEQTIDLSVFRNFRIGEHFRTQFRGEFFNVLNYTNFGLPGAQVGSPTYGIINSASAARAIQLGLKLSF